MRKIIIPVAIWVLSLVAFSLHNAPGWMVFFGPMVLYYLSALFEQGRDE